VKEIFLAIPLFPGYKISRTGKVKGPDGNLLSPRKDKDGYLRVDLRRNKTRYTRFVHTLVANTFNGLPNEEVNHKDKNKNNNHSSNLEHISKRDNLKHRDKKS
jgi:hypothetical protein